MRTSDTVSDIQVDDIDLTDKRFCLFKPFTDVNHLVKSVLAVGLIHPVMLRPSPEGRFIVVSGFNRVQAFRSANLQSIPAKVFTGSDSACLEAAITAVTFRREISATELIRCVTRLSEFADAHEIAINAPGLFNTRLNASYIGQLIRIGKLGSKGLELIDTGRLSLKTAADLLPFGEDDRNRLFDLFFVIKASASVQKEVVRHLCEISKRERTDIASILAEKEMQMILDSADSDPAGATGTLRQTLFSRRYPQLSCAQQTLKKNIAALKTVPGLKIEKSPTFEDPHLYVSFKFKTQAQCRRYVGDLNRIADSSEFQKILDQ